MMDLRFNKKGGLGTDIVAWVFGLLLIFTALYFTFDIVVSEADLYEKAAPELSYKFPATFIHSFLMKQISDEDEKELGLDISGDYFVRDVVWLNNDVSKKLVLKYRDEYLKEISDGVDSNGHNVHYFYKMFSGSNYDENELLKIEINRDSIPSLDQAIRDKNYFFYLRTKDDTYTVIYFLNENVIVEDSKDADETSEGSVTDSANNGYGNVGGP